MFSTRKTIFKNYTMVEILVVLAIVGILMGIALGGINGMLKRQGASGAVRNISSKLSLARSYAVMKNSYVALLVPCNRQALPTSAAEATKIGLLEPPATNFDYTSPGLKNYFTQTRLCVVTPNTAVTPVTYTFCSWIDGNEWDSLPSGTSVYIYESPQQVTGADGANFSAVVFSSNGVLVGSNPAKLKAFMASYVSSNVGILQLVFEGKRVNGWKISINPFTGRASYEKEN